MYFVAVFVYFQWKTVSQAKDNLALHSSVDLKHVNICMLLSLFMTTRGQTHIRGATTAEKLRGTKVWVPTPGRFGAGGDRPLLL